MATQGFHVIQDENRNVYYGGTSIGKETNVSKTMKKGLGGLKPLSDITNSGMPSLLKVLKKNFPTKGSDVEVQYRLKSQKNVGHINGTSVARQSVVPNRDKRTGKGGRRALADISNSKKLSSSNIVDTRKKAAGSTEGTLSKISILTKLSCQAVKKSCSMTLDDIADEQCLHNHQECIDAQRRGLDLQSIFATLGFDDDFSTGWGPPKVHQNSSQTKDDFASPLRYMKYEDVPGLLNDVRLIPRIDTIQSPSSSCYTSPKFGLLMSP